MILLQGFTRFYAVVGKEFWRHGSVFWVMMDLSHAEYEEQGVAGVMIAAPEKYVLEVS